VSGLSNDGGINFGRKTNFGETETPNPTVEEPKEVVVEHSQEQTDKQIRLEAKLQNAKSINYSGFAVNGGSVMTLVFGLNSIISDPNTLTMLNQINDMFGLDINFEMVLSNIESFKMQLIGIFISIQTMFVGYQDTCKKMKEQDTESFMKVINGELDKII
jgi:hypothetical protein